MSASPDYLIRFSVPLDAKQLAKGVSVPQSVSLQIIGELRSTSMEGLGDQARVLSLWVVNDRTVTEQERDRSFIFQVRLALHYEPGFLWRPNRRGEDAPSDDDPRVLALLFRDKKEWAVGHNTSILPPEPDRTAEFAPWSRPKSLATKFPMSNIGRSTALPSRWRTWRSSMARDSVARSQRYPRRTRVGSRRSGIAH